MKMTKEEKAHYKGVKRTIRRINHDSKIEHRYGDPFFRAASLIKPSIAPYYEMFKECNRSIRFETVVFYIMLVVFIAANILDIICFRGISILISPILLACLLYQSINIRVEILWRARYTDKMFDMMNAEEFVEALEARTGRHCKKEGKHEA